MTSPPGPGAALATDFALMASVANRTDTRNDEIRGMLAAFIAAMNAVPPSVWSGTAAVRFREVVERWNSESLKLHSALSRIADTIRGNERLLRDVADGHSQRIDSVAANL